MPYIRDSKEFEKNGRVLCVQTVQYGENHFELEEEGALPLGTSRLSSPRVFASEAEAVEYLENNYTPGRRTDGWTPIDRDHRK